MSKKIEMAIELFLKGFNCSQSVVYGFREEIGLTDDAALKMTSGFGAGMGRKGELCGAVTGGILVLGMRHGRGKQTKNLKPSSHISKHESLWTILPRGMEISSAVNCLVVVTL